MAQSIRSTICQINNALSPVFPGSKFYGVAISTEREKKVQPVSDEMPVSYDDDYSLQAYHKINSVQVTYKPGVGRNDNTINTFSMSMFIFNNDIKTGLKQDEVAMIIQSLIAGINISSVSITPVSFILNTQAVFAAEYRGNEFRLPESMSLTQMNYTIEVTFKSGCFDLCPEDFSSCKTN